MQLELAEQAEMHVEDLTPLPPVEEMLAVRIDSFEDSAIEALGSGSETPLRGGRRDGLAANGRALFASVTMDGVPFRH
jgi:hypothetical protein